MSPYRHLLGGLPACALAVCALPAAAAVDVVVWNTPTPVTLERWEVTETPRGALLSWSAAGEQAIRGYRVQVRSTGGRWRSAGPMIHARKDGLDGRHYAFLHAGGGGKASYRLVEITLGGWVLPVEVTEQTEVPARAPAGKRRAASAVAKDERQALRYDSGGAFAAPEAGGWSWAWFSGLLALAACAGLLARARGGR